MSIKKIIVTGATGYIGSVLTHYLEESGYECTGYDVGFFRSCEITPTIGEKTIFKDVRQINESDLSQVDAVIHLAGISNDPVGALTKGDVYDPTRHYTYRLASLCKRCQIRFIFASSCSIYGVGQDKLLSESTKPNPQTGYSTNKVEIEDDLRSLSDATFSPIALRFSTIFGMSPRIRFDVVINMFVGMAITRQEIVLNSDGLSWRPHLHILDACEAIRCAVESSYCGGRLMTVNVGMDENNCQTINVARMIQNLLPGTDISYLRGNCDTEDAALIRDGKISGSGRDNRTYQVSFDLIRKVFPAFRCRWGLSEGIQDMIAAFEGMQLGKSTFSSEKFYRLEYLQNLHSRGILSDDLQWVSDQPPQ